VGGRGLGGAGRPRKQASRAQNGAFGRAGSQGDAHGLQWDVRVAKGDAENQQAADVGDVVRNGIQLRRTIYFVDDNVDAARAGEGGRAAVGDEDIDEVSGRALK